jgi:multicomponent K+:H+ antiporter subunit E
MRTALARPPVLLTVLLLGIWLLLNQTLALRQIVFGGVLAVLIAWTSTTLRPLVPNVKRFRVAIGLVLLVLLDIVRSNVAVARIVLRNRKVRSGFLDIPLEMRDPHGLALLAVIVTSTPGTVWVDLSDDGGTLTLHVLDLENEAEFIRWFKERYERRLMRIFE